MEKIKAIRFGRSIKFPRAGEYVYQSEPIMEDLGPTAYFYHAGPVDRLVKEQQARIDRLRRDFDESVAQSLALKAEIDEYEKQRVSMQAEIDRLTAEVERLKAEVEKANRWAEESADANRNMCEYIAENAKLREALGFYAREDTYQPIDPHSLVRYYPIFSDSGAIARAARGEDTEK
jgi:cell division protein FtsB